METVIASLRRIIAVSVGVVLFALAVLDLTVYHLALDTMGRLEVRPGLNALFATLPFHLSVPIDTDVTINDLNYNDRGAIEKLAKGQEWGIWSHRDPDGLHNWLSKVKPAPRPSRGIAYLDSHDWACGG